MDNPPTMIDPAADADLREVFRASCQRIARVVDARCAAVVMFDGGRLSVLGQAGDGVLSSQLQQHVLASHLGAGGTPCPTAIFNWDGLCWILSPLRDCEEVPGALLLGCESSGFDARRERERAATLCEALVASLQLHRMGQRLRSSEAQYRLMFLHNPLPMYVSSFESRRMLAVNPAMLSLYGYTEAEFLALAAEDLLHDRDPARVSELLAETAPLRRIQGLKRRHRTKSGRAIDVEIWTDEIEMEGRLVRLVLIYDVTERLRAEREVRQLAFFDTLTGLPNRAHLHQGIRRMLEDGQRDSTGAAVLLLDLDHFKVVNEIWGHERGDQMLKEIAIRIMAARPNDLVARLGGDEFAVVVDGLSGEAREMEQQARRAGRQILGALEKLLRVGAIDYPCHASMGIVPFGGETGCVEAPSVLLQRADMALYEAKARGRQAICVFDERLQATVTARIALEMDARRALAERGFSLYYQPQVDARGDVTGVEALARWEHARRGFVPPAEFIPLCEENGLIVGLGEQVLDLACETLSTWKSDPLLAQLSVAVNVSSQQFRQPGFVETVLNALSRSGAPARRLKLELTESVMVDNLESVVEKMATLKGLGVTFSLDDFGTGYSSLGYLKLLPFDQLKIDQSFVRDILTDGNDAAIARTVIALGQSLGLEVIAEGVESAGHAEFLARHGCMAYQGYLYGRPMPRREFESWLARRVAQVSQLTS